MTTPNSYPEGFSGGRRLSTNDLADWFDVDERTIRRWRSDEGLPYEDAGMIAHYEMAVREWVKNRKRKGRK